MQSFFFFRREPREVTRSLVQYEAQRRGELQWVTPTKIHFSGIVCISDMPVDDVCRSESVQRTASGKSGDSIVALQLVKRDVWAILPESGNRLGNKVVVGKDPRNGFRMLRQFARPSGFILFKRWIFRVRQVIFYIDG